VPQCSQYIAPRSMACDYQGSVDEGAKDREFGPFREINAEHGLSLRFAYNSVGVDKRAGSVPDLWRPHNQGVPVAA
jgi:hypothetical protein